MRTIKKLIHAHNQEVENTVDISDSEMSAFLQEAEDIVILNQYKKESTVFQASAETLLPFLLALPEMMLDWRDELRYATDNVWALIVDYCPSISGELLAEWAQEQQGTVLQAIARHPSTPIGVLEKLASAGYGYQLAHNPKIPHWLLHRLVSSDNTRVRFAVACHPQTDLEDLEGLAHDLRPMVREAIASRPHLSESAP